MKAKFGIVLLLAVVLGFAIGATRTEKTHIMDVELARPVKGAEGVEILNVTMFDKVTDQQVASMLKSQLEGIVAVYKPTEDVLATAWNANEDKIGESMIYSNKHKKIMTWKEYEATLKK